MVDVTRSQNVGVTEEKEVFVPKSFPRNPGLIELAHAVNQYRQAVKALAQLSKHVGVGNGR